MKPVGPAGAVASNRQVTGRGQNGARKSEWAVLGTPIYADELE
jgi:hypothetical protein